MPWHLPESMNSTMLPGRPHEFRVTKDGEGEHTMRALLKPFSTWILLVVLAFAAEYAVHLSYRTMLAYVPHEFEKQFTQGAYIWVGPR